MAGGAKYANGNYKSQQKAYNKTRKGLKIRTRANALNRKLGTYGNGDGKDAAPVSYTHLTLPTIYSV